MIPEWLKDGRKIPDDVMYYIRGMAVYAIRELGHSPEVIAKTYDFNRHCIYQWLNLYDANGFDALNSVMPLGATPVSIHGVMRPSGTQSAVTAERDREDRWATGS